MRQLIIALICAFIIMPSVTAYGYSKDSQKFQYKYEGDFLPSDENTVPRWERSFSGGDELESLFCSVADGVLTIDTLTTPGPAEAASYFIPGLNSSMIQDPDTLESTGEFYTWGSSENPWQPNVEIGYTIEMRFKVIGVGDNNATFAFWLYAQEGGLGWSVNWQFYTNKITTHTSSGDFVHYTGDLTDQMHVFRVVRKANTRPKDINNPEGVYDLYLDGALIAANTTGVGTFWKQDDLTFGDAAGGSGGTDVNVEVDYVRFDLTGAYTPLGVGPAAVCGDDGYLIGDLNDNCRNDLGDFAIIASNWMLSTDPTGETYIDCTDPANAGICQQ